MQVAQLTLPQRAAPVAFTVALHAFVFYMLATATGFIPKPEVFKDITIVDVPPDESRKFRQDNISEDPNGLIDRREVNIHQREPIIEIEKGSEPPKQDLIGGSDREIAQQFSPAHLVKFFEPPYPASSIRLLEEGVVYVRVTITPLGDVIDTQLERSCGFSRLDDAALKAVLRWKFAPAMRDQQAVGANQVVAVRFQLRNGSTN